MIKLVGSEERGHAASWSRARYRTVLDLAWSSTEFGALRRTPMVYHLHYRAPQNAKQEMRPSLPGPAGKPDHVQI